MAANELIKTPTGTLSTLKAYYRFESGALTTDTQGTHTLTAISDPAEDASGQFGGAVAFDGNDAYSATDHADWRPTGAFSVGCWFKCATKQDAIIISNANLNTGDYSGWQFGVLSDGDLIAATYPTNGSTTEASLRVNGNYNYGDSAWHHEVFSYDGTTGRMYYDGKMVGSAAMAAPAYDATNPPRIGCRVFNGSNNLFFTGSLDDVFLINGTALSADQIKELYEGRIYGELRPNQFGTTVGLWHLNGNSTDFSGNNNHGTDTAITYSAANGKLGQGAGFNGSSSLIYLGNAVASLNLTTLSICAWIKTSDTTHIQTIYGNRTDGNNEFSFRVQNAGGTILLSTNAGAGGRYASGTTVVTDGVWHHVAMTKNGAGTGIVNIYVDGHLDGTGDAYNTTNSHATIGACRQATDYIQWFNGAIDEVSVHSVVLTANQIRQIYAYQKGLLGRYA